MAGKQPTTSIVYREIPGHPDYFAGSDGSIWSHRFRKQKRLAEYLNLGRFHVRIVNLYGRSYTARVHSLVCAAFHGPCPNGMVCRHLNGLRRDNRPENLAWGTHSENSQDTIRHGSGFRDGIDEW